MDLELNPVNTKSYIPIHVQFKEQLKHLILGGKLKVGERLPSIRALAGYMRINRNTVARVVAELEREGYVETRRGSGVFVVEPPASSVDLKRQRLLEWVIERARDEGVSVEELGYELLARTPLVERVKIAFVECNQPQVEQFTKEIEEQLPVEVEGMLIEELERRVAEDEELPWRLVTTTFFHYQEVEALVKPRGVETVALMVEMTVETINRLAELPAGTPVGVVGNSRSCTTNLLRSLEGAGLENLDLRVIYDHEDTEELQGMLGDVQAVVCGSVPARRLAELGASPQLEIIVEDRMLEKGGVEILGRMLRG